MNYSKKHLLSTVAIVPLMFGVVVGLDAVGNMSVGVKFAVAGCNPCAAKACNPCAAAACNPCAASACNPCAASNPCNPCAASACNPCNPCGAAPSNASQECFIPRLQQASACNPCAAGNPCNPCSANACNPCAASACNPCAAASPCNPCAASACNPCAANNPCAASNPCAAGNPCAASACNPCNPCGPCGAGAVVELTDAEAAAAYDCLYPEIKAAYANTGVPATRNWRSWAKRFSSGPYNSATHGGRYVNNYANTAASGEYGKFEDLENMPVNSVLIKDSFSADSHGSLSVGPLFIMEKMGQGFNPDTGDWRYYMFTPDGKLFGITKGTNSAGMAFCHECHVAAEDTDFMMFLPDEYRTVGN